MNPKQTGVPHQAKWIWQQEDGKIVFNKIACEFMSYTTFFLLKAKTSFRSFCFLDPLLLILIRNRIFTYVTHFDQPLKIKASVLHTHNQTNIYICCTKRISASKSSKSLARERFFLNWIVRAYITFNIHWIVQCYV